MAELQIIIIRHTDELGFKFSIKEDLKDPFSSLWGLLQCHCVILQANRNAKRQEKAPVPTRPDWQVLVHAQKRNN